MSQELKRGSEKDKIHQKQRKQHRQHEEIQLVVSYNGHFNNSITASVRSDLKSEKDLREWLHPNQVRGYNHG